MPLKKGQTNNPKGRPKGSKNKAAGKLREMVTEFLEGNFKTILVDFKLLHPKDRARFYIDMLNYGLPKLQATSVDIDFEKMTDEQLDYIIEQLKKGSNEQKGED